MEAVIKIGGSIAEQPKSLRDLCIEIGKVGTDYRIVIVPGGSQFADLVRKFDKRFSISSDVSHKMAIYGMDQFGLLLSELIPRAVPITSLRKVRTCWNLSAIPVFLPSKMMFRTAPLEASWDVTSDSIAALVACLIKANAVILVKDVDGVFSQDPKNNIDAKIFRTISAFTLSRLSQAVVDRHLPKLLIQKKMECYVVNGNYPERVKMLLEGHETIATLITP
jgi:5-(aminomethyl)-3-furanmethanol phosphate kinase